jgi:hypothetical protein
MPYFLQIQQQQQSNLKIRLFITIVAEDDDLVSPESTLSVNHYVSSREKITRVYCGDHIGLCVSSIAHKKLWPEVSAVAVTYNTDQENYNQENILKLTDNNTNIKANRLLPGLDFLKKINRGILGGFLTHKESFDNYIILDLLTS